LKQEFADDAAMPQLNSTQLNSTQLNSTQLNSTQLNSTQLWRNYLFLLIKFFERLPKLFLCKAPGTSLAEDGWRDYPISTFIDPPPLEYSHEHGH
jgi:hypothetical protein